MKTHRINLRDWESAGLLAGRITALCRVVRPQPELGKRGNGEVIDPGYFVWSVNGETIPVTDDCMYRILTLSPFGSPGDVVLGREAWATGCNLDQWSAATIASEAANYGYQTKGSSHACCPLYYKADGGKRLWSDTEQDDIRAFGARGRWRSSTTQPDDAIRHRLTTKSVRCVRAWSITWPEREKLLGSDLAREEVYAERFDRDNPKTLYADNPWVWVGEVGR